LGTMRVTQQIDALHTLATNPVQYLVVPRLWAATLSLPCLVAFSVLVGILGGRLIAVEVLGTSPVVYYARAVEYLQPTYPTLDTDLGDIDGDGDAELVHLFPDGVLAWDLERPGTEPVRLEWPMAGHDARNGSDYHADQPLPLPSFLRGDARRDGELDLADPFAFFTELFEGGSDPCPARLDFDADGTLALDDGVALLAWLFLDGPPPDTGPFPACGPIPDGELLPCALDHCF
ncbi:MAG: ABC transporter permease, partial [Dehalococcoidia bacterium]